MSKDGIKILCIGDTHADPLYDHKRFKLIGEVVAAEQPDVVWAAGDWGDVRSISDHQSKLSLEGQRYDHDVESILDSQSDFFAPIRARKKKLPRFVMSLGNHENRVNRLLEQNPTLEGRVSVDDFRFREFGWEVHDYQVPVKIAGYSFCHNFPSGKISHRIQGGDYLGHHIARKGGVSRVVGHDHGFHLAHVCYEDRTIQGINVGCMVHPDHMKESWCRSTSHSWWRGLVVLDGAKDGMASVRQIRAEDFGA